MDETVSYDPNQIENSIKSLDQWRAAVFSASCATRLAPVIEVFKREIDTEFCDPLSLIDPFWDALDNRSFDLPNASTYRSELTKMIDDINIKIDSPLRKECHEYLEDTLIVLFLAIDLFDGSSENNAAFVSVHTFSCVHLLVENLPDVKENHPKPTDKELESHFLIQKELKFQNEQLGLLMRLENADKDLLMTIREESMNYNLLIP